MKWGFHVAAAVSLVLCVAVAVAAAWIHSRQRTDIFTTANGARFVEYAVRPTGVSVRWLSGVPPVSVPPRQSLGWSVRAGDVLTPDGAAQLNVPTRSERTSSFAGVGVTSGSAQILRRAWFVYYASPLFPLRGIALSWPLLLIATAVLPVAWLVIVLTRRSRGRADYKSPTLARAIQP